MTFIEKNWGENIYTPKEEAQALQKQRQHKLKTIDNLKKAKILKATEEYTTSLILLEQCHLVVRWKRKEEVTREYDKLISETAKREATKLQINIGAKGLIWTIMIHPWQKRSYVHIRPIKETFCRYNSSIQRKSNHTSNSKR